MKTAYVTGIAVAIGALLAGCATDSANPQTSAPVSAPVSAPAPVKQFENVAYLNNPTIQDVASYGNYLETTTGKPFFSTVVLFAANINAANAQGASDPDSATWSLYYNQQFRTLLQSKRGLKAIRSLQSKGIKVWLAYLPNHQYAGWSCPMDPSAATDQGNGIATAVAGLGLDGVVIDDEFSGCLPTQIPATTYSIASAMTSNPSFAGKTLSRALWSDDQFFQGPTSLAPLLGTSYSMDYWDAGVANVQPYLDAGMPKSKLGVGISLQYSNAAAAKSVASDVAAAGLAGVMVWAPNASFKTPDTAEQYFTAIAQGEYGAAAKVVYQS